MHSNQRGFTLMELLTVMAVLAILSVMILASFASIKGKAERGKCVNNLQGLYAAASSYLTDHQSWPQISTMDIEAPAYAKAWIEAYKPYKIGEENWKCATVQKALGDPPNDPNNPRLDYLPTSFDSKPSTPWLYPTHPWFIERADAHGDGNLIVFANGQLHSLNELKRAKK